MTTSHGKLTRVTIATQNISPFVKNSSLEKSAKTHDVTGYGVDDELHVGGLRGHSFSCSGVYDNTVNTGPRNVLNGQVGSTLAIVRQVEGLGAGKPQDAFSAILEKYVETNPDDDMVTWSADFKVTGPVTSTIQP